MKFYKYGDVHDMIKDTEEYISNNDLGIISTMPDDYFERIEYQTEGIQKNKFGYKNGFPYFLSSETDIAELEKAKLQGRYRSMYPEDGTTLGDVAKATPEVIANIPIGTGIAIDNAFKLIDNITGGAVTEVDNFLSKNFPNTLGKKVEYKIPEGAAATTGSLVGQYVVPGMGVYKMARGALLLAEPLTVGLFSSKDEGNLANVIEDMFPEFTKSSELSKTIIEGLSVDQDDPEVMARIKNIVADAVPFVVVEKFYKILKALKQNPEAIQELKSVGAAATPTEPPGKVEIVDGISGYKLDEQGNLKKNQGLPPNIKTVDDLRNVENTITQLTEEGKEGMFWYERSSDKILKAFGGNKEEAEKFVKLIALYSSNAAPGQNTAAALKAYYQFLNNEPIAAGMKALDKKASELLYEGKDFPGYKVNNFYVNLMKNIDPDKVQGITTDRWILRAFDYPSGGNPTRPQLDFIENTINTVAEKMNMQPYQVQAAIWSSIRAGRDPKKISQLAGDDFELAINNNLGQISWETAPGAKYNFFPEYQTADPKIKTEYHFDLTKALTDDEGKDIIASRLGLITPGQFDAPGVYQNSLGELEFNPGTQTEFVAPKKTGAAQSKVSEGFEAKSAIDPSAVELINAYAYIKGKLLKQEAVAWHRPVYNAQKSLNNGVEVKYQLNSEETKNLTNALNEEFSNFPGFVVPIGSPDGFRLIINPDITGYSIPEFQQKVFNAINNTINVNDDQVVAFSTNTGYIEIDDYKFEKPQGSSEESSDLYRKVSDILSELEPRVEEVFSKYESEYGWSR